MCKGLLTVFGLVHLCICLTSCPWRFSGVPWKEDAFNDLHWTRLEINLLVNLSYSIWNNRTSGDVVFLVGEHIKGARPWQSPWTPKGTSGCQISLTSTGRGREWKVAWASSLNTLHKIKVFQPTSNSVLCISWCLAFYYSNMKEEGRIKDKKYYFWLPSPQMQKYLNTWLLAPTHSTLIFLPAFLSTIMFSVFCWEGKCLQQFFRCHEAFLNWKHMKFGVSMQDCHIIKVTTKNYAHFYGTHFLVPHTQCLIATAEA